MNVSTELTTGRGRAVTTDRRWYRWAGTEIELIEQVIGQHPSAEGSTELRSLRGLEDSVACVLAEMPSTQ